MKRLPVPEAFATRDHLLDDVFREKHQLCQIVGMMLPSVQCCQSYHFFLVKTWLKAIQIFNSSFPSAVFFFLRMALKRLMKEWECWDQKSPNRAMEEFGTFDEEHNLWKLQPQRLADEKVDYLTWEAELRVSSGPFQGASFVYILHYPRDYPFKPPRLKVAFTGFPVAYQDIQEGWNVYMVPPTSSSGQRVAGAVTDAKEGGMTVQWKQQRLGNGCFLRVDFWIFGREMRRQHPLICRHCRHQILYKTWWVSQDVMDNCVSSCSVIPGCLILMKKLMPKSMWLVKVTLKVMTLRCLVKAKMASFITLCWMPEVRFVPAASRTSGHHTSLSWRASRLRVLPLKILILKIAPSLFRLAAAMRCAFAPQILLPATISRLTLHNGIILPGDDFLPNME